jgi:hypothetical protein
MWPKWKAVRTWHSFCSAPRFGGPMDFVAVLLAAGFFLASWGFVVLCDRL